MKNSDSIGAVLVLGVWLRERLKIELLALIDVRLWTQVNEQPSDSKSHPRESYSALSECCRCLWPCISSAPGQPRYFYHVGIDGASIGDYVPNFDITELYTPNHRQDFLVNSEKFGAALAEKFSRPESTTQDYNVVLMANHGFTTLGFSIRQAVYRAVYTQVNAGIQTNALMLRNAEERVSELGSIRFLNAEQASGSEKMSDDSAERPWQLWVREVEVCPLYQNEVSNMDPSGGG
ncbi:hypothetical protein NHQ30_004793 [Ciborinia camelliae]|nr:hypothetical protein NHQ30_004793 [Ciborinia camelliae]